ncbi:MAG: toll/interleukin-1 receptor domain-containing protein [Thermoanaerobaculia bacterium]
MAHDVFLSYASEDKPEADAACALLERRGLRCWVAPRDILPGSDWSSAIVDAIRAARVLVLVFSRFSNDSVQVKREVERAVSLGLPILPFRLDDVPLSKHMEYFISSPHWLDAMSPPLEAHLEKLADTTAALLGHAARATPPPPPALPPAPDAGMEPTLLEFGDRFLGWKKERRFDTVRRAPGAATAAIAVGVLGVLWNLNGLRIAFAPGYDPAAQLFRIVPATQWVNLAASLVGLVASTLLFLGGRRLLVSAPHGAAVAWRAARLNGIAAAAWLAASLAVLFSDRNFPHFGAPMETEIVLGYVKVFLLAAATIGSVMFLLDRARQRVGAGASGR